MTALHNLDSSIRLSTSCAQNARKNDIPGAFIILLTLVFVMFITYYICMGMMFI